MGLFAGRQTPGEPEVPATDSLTGSPPLWWTLAHVMLGAAILASQGHFLRPGHCTDYWRLGVLSFIFKF